MHKLATTCVVFACLQNLLLAQTTSQSVKFAEPIGVGYMYHVSCRVNISGRLAVPEDKGQAKDLVVVGSSAIEYDERILVEKDRKVDRTLRCYRRMDFDRKVGDQMQQNTLRPDVRRMVILRQNQYEVPFSPDGPLTWSEIDLVRTDVFTPALVGLLPKNPVAPEIGRAHV